MNREFRVFTLYGLPVSIVPGFFAGTGLTLLALAGIGLFALGFGLIPALAGAVAATALMWLSELVHQLGHAIAARRAGHPMIAITLGRYLVLVPAFYPSNEGARPPARALAAEGMEFAIRRQPIKRLAFPLAREKARKILMCVGGEGEGARIGKL